MSSRWISFSEVSTALDCQARWDFKYSDHLAGSSLKEKAVAPMLSGGKAWGAAVAAWHANVDQLDAGTKAIEAMDESLERDAERQREQGVHEQDKHDELRLDLLRVLSHYVEVTEPVKMDPVREQRLLVPIPSRHVGAGHKRKSNRYKLLCYIDATETDDEGRVFIDEFKFRSQLTPLRLIELSRQIRWYAWAWQEAYGEPVAGVYVNERLSEAPKPARILKGGKVSHAVNQLTTVASYEAACQENGVEPREETVEAFKKRQWQQRVLVRFRPSEIEAAGQELVSAAKLIHLLEAGELEPLRNVKRANCNWCPFKDICPNPDNDLVDALFERRPTKRSRDTEGAAAT